MIIQQTNKNEHFLDKDLRLLHSVDIVGEVMQHLRLHFRHRIQFFWNTGF